MAYSGIMHLTGEPEGPPLIPGSAGLADYLSGVYGAFGALAALRHRDATGAGQEVDVALYEATFQMLGDLVETYDHFGEAQGPTGARNPHAAPHNNFPSRDGRWVAIGCSSDQLFRKLATAIGQPELPRDPRFSSNPKRVEHRDEIEHVVADWTKQHTADDVVLTLTDNGVPASLVYTIEDAVGDPHYWQRGAIVRTETDDIGPLTTRGVAPRLTRTPGHVGRAGGQLGRDNNEVYCGLLGLTPDQLAILARDGVV
jgi:crotonobetainyl-CoA:carnitine CoA-transferase CaiB-like acyl-CoA transferase